MLGLPPESWWILLVVGALVALALFVWKPMRAAAREAHFGVARQLFHVQRERLEMKFVQLATLKARDQAPNWADCDFDDDVAYVRDRNTGELSAFVAVTVAMDSLPEDPTDVGDLIGNLRSGTAVFRFDREHWETDGRAILNLSPSEAIRFYKNNLVVVDQEFAEQS